MSKPGLIGRFHAGSTPAVHNASTRSAHGLPEDIVREAANRLAIMAVVCGVLWFLGSVFGHLAFREMTDGRDPRWRRIEGSDYIAIAAILVSIVVYLYARRPGRKPERMIDLGHLFLVFTAFALGLNMHWDALPHEFVFHPMITWTGAAILIFASIVPSSPGKTAVASLVAASMNPLCLLAAKLKGGTWERVTFSDALVTYHPDYLLAGVAVVISLVITRLSQEVSKAREMGSYQLGELLGSGGMGEVYRATHRMLARPAAIKLIRPEMLGAADSHSAEIAITRFKREAQVAANLRSPHTIELYDFGVTEDRTFYFVMELLEGTNLETLVAKSGPLPADRAIYILRQVCESLEEAHAAGLVHRDIKPANIHVGRLGLRHDFVKVLDFGLVKSVTKKEHSVTLETAVGMTPGTPAYMAPELARGDDYDARADIYALGCVAYFIVTGQLVFQSANALDMMMKHQMELPVRPSKRAPLLVPAALEEIILACLEKEPAKRPRTAGELSRTLAAVPIPPWNDDRARQCWEEEEPAANAELSVGLTK
jgi:eukaryotic-like serine/threonine-protein kinase